MLNYDIGIVFASEIHVYTIYITHNQTSENHRIAENSPMPRLLGPKVSLQLSNSQPLLSFATQISQVGSLDATLNNPGSHLTAEANRAALAGFKNSFVILVRLQ